MKESDTPPSARLPKGTTAKMPDELASSDQHLALKRRARRPRKRSKSFDPSLLRANQQRRQDVLHHKGRVSAAFQLELARYPVRCVALPETHAAEAEGESAPNQKASPTRPPKSVALPKRTRARPPSNFELATAATALAAAKDSALAAAPPEKGEMERLVDEAGALQIAHLPWNCGKAGLIHLRDGDARGRRWSVAFSTTSDAVTCSPETTARSSASRCRAQDDSFGRDAHVLSSTRSSPSAALPRDSFLETLEKLGG
jgi:hypothetical protein